MIFQIIIIGDEILSGSIKDFNANYLCTKITEIGGRVRKIQFISDDEEEIRDALGRAENADFVLVTGGLGPTTNDKTVLCASVFFNVPLILYEDALSNINDFFRKRGIKMPETNKKQAYFPEGSTTLKNEIGTAPGFKFLRGKTVYFFLPGVPAEMKKMADNYLFPEVMRLKGEAVRTVIVKTFGISEAKLDEELEALRESFRDIKIWTIPAFIEIQIRGTISGTEAEIEIKEAEFKKALEKAFGHFIFASYDEKMEEAVGKLLKGAGKTIAAAESCTGGLIANRITDVPGSSDYFIGSVTAYSNKAKENILGVSPLTLKEYGAVSSETAVQMAEGVRRKFNVDIGIATTGIAGPSGGSDEKPVGTLYFALSATEGTFSRRYQFEFDRLTYKQIASQIALNWVRRYLLREIKF